MRRATGMFLGSLCFFLLFLFCAHTILFFSSLSCIFLCLCVGYSSPWPVHIPVVLGAGHLTVGRGWLCLKHPICAGRGYRLFYWTCGRLRRSQLGSREYESTLYQDLAIWTSGQRHSWIKLFVYFRTECVGYAPQGLNSIIVCKGFLWNKPIKFYLRSSFNLQNPVCRFKNLMMLKVNSG